MQPIMHIDIAGNTCNKPTHCLLILQVIPAISLYIACSLTAYAKYLQLAYSGAGNLWDFTYNLHVNVLLIVQVKHTHCLQPIIHIDIAGNTRNMLIYCLQFECICKTATTCLQRSTQSIGVYLQLTSRCCVDIKGKTFRLHVVLDMFWTCFRHVLDMFWTWFGHVLDMFWTCFGHVLDMFWTSFGHGLDMFWSCF